MSTMHAGLVVAAAALAACGGASLVRVPPPPAAVPVIEHLDAPLTFGPVAHPAAAYDEVPPAIPVPDGGVMPGLAALVPAGGELTRDGRLDLAAAELVPLAERGATPSPELVEFALDAQGVVQNGHLMIARGATAEEQLAQLTPRLGDKLAAPNAHVGIAAGRGLVVVILAYTPPVHFEVAPRQVVDATDLVGLLSAPYKVPRLAITHEDRTVEHLDVAVQPDGHFHARFACAAHTGTQWLAVEADDQIEPLAIVPLSCAVPPPATYRLESDASVTTADVTQRIAALINRERVAAHVAPLLPDGPSTAAAEAYAAVMARTKDVAHDLDHTTPPSRLEAAGRVPLIVSESTLKADNLRQATEVLLDDPMYRQQVVDPAVTHMGIGVVADRTGELFVAIEYIQIEAPLDVAEIRARVEKQIVNSGRSRRTSTRGVGGTRETLGPPSVDEDLTKLANELATEIALRWGPTPTMGFLERRLVDEAIRYTKVDFRVVLITQADRVDAHALFPERAVIDNIGVAVAQSSREGPNSGRAYLVVLAGRY